MRLRLPGDRRSLVAIAIAAVCLALVAGWLALRSIDDERNRLRGRGLPFRFQNYRNGDPYVRRTRDGLPIL